MARRSNDSQWNKYLGDHIFRTHNSKVQETPECPSYTLKVKLHHRNIINLRKLEAHLDPDMRISEDKRTNIITVIGVPPRDGYDQEILAVVQKYDDTATIESSVRH